MTRDGQAASFIVVHFTVSWMHFSSCADCYPRSSQPAQFRSADRLDRALDPLQSPHPGTI